MKMFPRVKPPSPGADEGWAVLGSLMSGLLLFGAAGWLLDHWWGTRVMAPIGAVIGLVLGIYAAVMRHAQRVDSEQVPGKVSPSTRAAADAARALREAKTANRMRAMRPAGSPAPADVPSSVGTPRETAA